MTTERWLGRRFFRRLSDVQLIEWRPADGYHEGNVSACNREVRRRAAKVELPIYDWIQLVRLLASEKE